MENLPELIGVCLCSVIGVLCDDDEVGCYIVLIAMIRGTYIHMFETEYHFWTN